MNQARCSLILIAAAAAVGCLTWGDQAGAANMAMDVASNSAYDNGWQTGDNGGSGFGPWELLLFSNNPPSSAQFFIGDSAGNGSAPSGDINTAGKAFGLSADQDIAFAFREFSGGPLAPGQTFSLDFDNGFTGNGSVGFSLGSPFAPSLAFGFDGADLTYGVTDSLGTNSILMPFTDDGLRIDVTLGALNTYTLRINNLISAIGTLDNPDLTLFALVNSNAGSDPGNHVFFGSFAVTAAMVPEPSSLALMALGIACLPLRRRSPRATRCGRRRRQSS